MTIAQFPRAAARAGHLQSMRNMPLQSLAGRSLGARFHAWRGRSGQRYICSVFPAHRLIPDAGLPDYANAVILAATRDIDGVRKIIDIFQRESAAEEGLAPFVAEALAAGAAEWHVHLLATSAGQRRAVVADLEPPAVVTQRNERLRSEVVSR